MTVQNAGKVTKINLRIITKSHERLQTWQKKTPVKFQKDWLRNVGVDVHKRYLLLEGETELQQLEYYVFEKSEDKKYTDTFLYENKVKQILV